MTMQALAAAIERTQKVLQRRPAIGLHVDPPAMAEWRGGTRVVSRREFARMGERIEQWHKHVADLARDNDLDLVRVGLDRWEMETTLIEFARERRLRKFQ